MLSIISEIDEFKGSWKLLGQMAPEKLQALKKVATIESVGSSNRIEGNKLSDKQVEELLSRINKQSFANRDEEEVADRFGDVNGGKGLCSQRGIGDLVERHPQ